MKFWDVLGGAIGGLFGMGSTAISNSQNLQAVKETNKANTAINQANIDAAKEMYNRQEAFNREMYEKQLAYNDPKAQRQRMESAGINPWTADFGTGGASSPSAPSYSQPSQIPMQAGKVNPILTPSEGMSIGMSVGQLGLINAQQDKTAAEASQAWSDAEFKQTMNQLAVARGISEIQGISEKTKGMMIDNYIKQSTSQYAIQSARYDSQYAYQQVRNAALDADLKQAQLPSLSQLAQVHLDSAVLDQLQKRYNIKLTQEQIKTQGSQRQLIGQQIANLVITGQLTAEQVKKVYQETLLTEKNRLNIPWLNADQKQKMADALVDSQVNAAMLSGQQVTIGAPKAKEADALMKRPSWWVGASAAVKDFLPIGSLFRR